MIWRRSPIVLVAAAICLFSTGVLRAQSFGIELHNTTTPASGGMGGVSIARPQDVISPYAANPASLARFRCTQFMFGGSWVEPTYNFAHTGGILPAVGAFAAKSEAEGSALGDIAISQDLRALGIPATVGWVCSPPPAQVSASATFPPVTVPP